MTNQSPLDPALNCLPKDFCTFKSENIHVHLVGIGGVAMTALAGLFLDAGFKVSGSDLNLYPPMSDVLKSMNVELFTGYGADSLKKPDLVIIGNVVRKGFEVLKKIKDLALHYLSLPQALSQIFMPKTKNLVVAGCHGKTTTTSMAAKVWCQGNFNPGYMIGGASLDFAKPWHLAKKDWFIIEGDEYDSAFFNKEAKFFHYRPHTVILSSIEFDHADIYPDFDSLINAYNKLVKLIPSDGLLIANGDDPIVRQVAEKCSSKVEFYGLNKDNHWQILNYQTSSGGISFTLSGPNNITADLQLNKPGVYNALNAASVGAAFINCGGKIEDLKIALSNFKGVKRRQEVLGSFNGITLIDDFAHHPTAVRETIKALKGQYPGKRILAAFEARSNTSRRAIFQNKYPLSFQEADLVFLRKVSDPEKAPENDRLNIETLLHDIPTASLWENGQEIKDAILKQAAFGDVIVVMSNGSFDGLTNSLFKELSGKNSI